MSVFVADCGNCREYSCNRNESDCIRKTNLDQVDTQLAEDESERESEAKECTDALGRVVLSQLRQAELDAAKQGHHAEEAHKQDQSIHACSRRANHEQLFQVIILLKASDALKSQLSVLIQC